MKVLFMLISMNIGGTEKALLNMLGKMPRSEFDITILLLEKVGGYLNHIPDWVHTETLPGYENIKDILTNTPYKAAFNLFKELKIVKVFNLLFLHFICKISKDRFLFYKYILKNFPVVKASYDSAIAFAGPMDLISYYVLYKIIAKEKIQWIHFDISQIGINYKFASRMYNMFDKIFVVSREGMEKFINIFPGLRDKTQEFYNIISPSQINKLSNEKTGFKDNFNGIRTLTVGRLSKEKGQDITISVLAKLKQDGYNIRWYCIGEGAARKDYEILIKQFNVINDYILLGADPNPYPFMKECDIYVQSSRHEGYCITLAEAKCFDNPIICTNVTGAKEHITNEQTGLIAECTEKDIYLAVKRILDDEELRTRIKNNLKSIPVGSSEDMVKLFNLTK